MQYDYFIRMIGKAQTPHIKALAFPESCAPHAISASFAPLLSGIVCLLESEIKQLCREENSVLALFGLQPMSIAIDSKAPLFLNRIYNTLQPTQHFCCSLSYLIVPKTALPKLKSWDGSHSLVLDFTTGLIMDRERYLSYVLDEPSTKGIVFGSMDSMELSKAWKMVNNQQIKLTRRAHAFAA